MSKTSVIICCDGLCQPNPGGVATCGWVAYDNQNKKICEYSEVVCTGKGATNNVAEYSAVISAMQWALKQRYNNLTVEIRTDSKLIANQFNDIYTVRSPLLIPYYNKTRQLSNKFSSLSVKWISRKKNKEVDLLTRLAYDKYVFNKKNTKTRSVNARKLIGSITPLTKTIFTVPSQSNPDIVYIVDIARNTCTCPDFRMRGKKIGYCKHILAVQMSKVV